MHPAIYSMSFHILNNVQHVGWVEEPSQKWKKKNANLLLEKLHSNVFTAFFYFWECFFSHHSAAGCVWPAELISHPSMHLYHWTFHLTHIPPSKYPQFESVKEREKKHSGIPLLFASRVLSPNPKHSRAAWALSQRELHSPRLECTRPTCLGPWWWDHPGSVSLKHGSESGAQQSNDTLVELLDHGHQIPKKKEIKKWGEKMMEKVREEWHRITLKKKASVSLVFV